MNNVRSQVGMTHEAPIVDAECSLEHVGKPRARKLITISVPVYDEEGNIGRLIERLDAVTDSLSADYDFEFLFTDNASRDATFSKLLEASRRDPRIRVLRFSRNFGFQTSILANYLNARGDAAIQLDADLEDPPELIPQMLEFWQQGYKVVYGVRRRRSEFWFKTLLRKAFYRLLNRLSEVDLPHDAGDFRLIDRDVIEHLRATRDRNPYIRGIIANFGFSQTGIVYDRSKRMAGTSKFNIAKLIRLGMDGICSQSTKPIEIITFTGFTLSLVSIAGAFFYTIWYLIFGSNLPQGFTTLVFLMLVISGINMAFLGIIGEYVGRIFRNTRELPIPIILDRIEAPDAPKPDASKQEVSG